MSDVYLLMFTKHTLSFIDMSCIVCNSLRLLVTVRHVILRFCAISFALITNSVFFPVFNRQRYSSSRYMNTA